MNAGSADRGPSDPGLAGERTSLAWLRLGMAMLALPAAIIGYLGSGSALAIVSAAAAGLLGLAVLVASVRRQRVPAGSLARGTIRPPVLSVAGTAASVLLLSLSAAVLVTR